MKTRKTKQTGMDEAQRVQAWNEKAEMHTKRAELLEKELAHNKARYVRLLEVQLELAKADASASAASVGNGGAQPVDPEARISLDEFLRRKWPKVDNKTDRLARFIDFLKACCPPGQDPLTFSIDCRDKYEKDKGFNLDVAGQLSVALDRWWESEKSRRMDRNGKSKQQGNSSHKALKKACSRHY